MADTNILFSAVALPKDSPPTQVTELAKTGHIELIISGFILAELEGVLTRKASWDDAAVLAFRKYLTTFSRLVEPTVRVNVVKRIEADNRILECAITADADALVTGNMKDLRPLGSIHGIAILTPREFLDRYFPHYLDQ